MADYGPSPDELREICRAVGCRLKSVSQAHDGAHIYQIECKSHGAKVQLLAALAWYDATSERSGGHVRRIAEEVIRYIGAHTEEEQIAALHAFVRDTVRFQHEHVETFQHTIRTLEVGMGDCDDTARALAALLFSVGYEAGLDTLKDSSGEPVHVAAVVQLGGAWRWLETTIAARPGEHPTEAARRLGIATRSDLVSSGG